MKIKLLLAATVACVLGFSSCSNESVKLFLYMVGKEKVRRLQKRLYSPISKMEGPRW